MLVDRSSVANLIISREIHALIDQPSYTSSIMLYRAPIWGMAANVPTYVAKICSSYRIRALRVACSYRTISRKVRKNRMAVPQKTFIRSSQVTNMDLCVWARNKTTVHHMGLRKQVKSNESCLWKKTIRSKWSSVSSENWSCSDCSTWATWLGQFSVVHHRILAHWLKSAPFWPAKTSHLSLSWVFQQ